MNDRWIDELAIARGGKVGKIRKDAFDIPTVSGSSRDEPGVKLVQTLVIDDWTPKTLNRAMRGKLAERIKISRESHELIATEAFRQAIRPASGARRVQLIVVFPDARDRPDVDSLWKCLLDGMVTAGLLLDDDYENCELLPVIYRFGKKRTQIELTDIDRKTVEREA